MPSLTPTVRNILILWVGLWLISYVAWIGEVPLTEYLSFNPAALARFEFRGFLGLVTYGFVHERGFLHLLFNAWMFALFAPEAERLLGLIRFRKMLLLALFFGAMVHFLLGFFWLPFASIVLGGSGMVMAVLALNAAATPRLTLRLLVIDVPLHLLFLVLVGMDALQFIATLAGKQISVAADVHLVGAAIGYFTWKFSGATSFGRSHKKGLWDSLAQYLSFWARQARPRDSAKDEAELDRILDKIHEHGMPSLSAKERRFLQRRSKRPPR